MQFIRIDSEDQLTPLLARFKDADLALDTETTSKDAKVAELLKIVFSFDGETSYSCDAELLPLIPLTQVKRLRIQNFKYDYHVLYRHGVNLLEVPVIDPMLLHHLVDENAEYNLEYLTRTYYEDTYKKVFWDKYKTYEEASPEDALEYECKDAIYHYKLVDLLLDKLTGKQVLIQHVHRLANELLRTEIEGIRVDRPLMEATKENMGGQIDAYLPALRREFSVECQEWEFNKWDEEINKRIKPDARARVAKPDFNFGSTKQIQWLLYEKLKLPVLTRTKTKAPSTDYDTICKLLEQCGRLVIYRDYIDIKTIYGTFVKGLLERVTDGKIYPEFNVNGTVTGRISHSNPNMGNMPKEGVYRNFFLPDIDHAIIGADYEQLEIVIEAHVTSDPNLAKIVSEGASKHDITAEGLKIDRATAKTVNFALGYHCGVNKLSKILKCSHKEAQYQYNKYWDLYFGCRDLKLKTDMLVDAGLPVANLFGRKRSFPTVYPEPWMRDSAKRQAYNFMIQGPGGDFMNRSFYIAAKQFRERGYGRMLWTVHDEAVASVKREHVEEASALLVTTMQNVPKEYNLKYALKAKPYGPFLMWQKA